ncbi:MAG: hypothetical protein WAS33_06035 [Candidatus Promineifilaceae bacterium]|nr:hypothetical protein [Anaerolineaceae bacterium]
MDRNKWVWSGKPWQAFKTFAIIFSFVMNFVLLVVLLIAAPLILPIVDSIAEPLVGGLSDSFVDMSNATISQTIRLDTTMPISFTLPLQEETNVVLTEGVPLTIPAQFTLPGGGGQINGNVILELPAGLELPVALDLEVAVDQTIPVVMDVPVQIPLQDTDLGGPFNTLRGLFEPLDQLIKGLPSSNEELMNRVTQSNPMMPVDTAVR